MIVNRVERHLIKKSNPMWKTVDYYSYQAKNLYNEANYIVRQYFINNRTYHNYNKMDKMRKILPSYYLLGTQCSQCTLILLDRNWLSFFRAIKDCSKKKGIGYSGRPALPKYKKKDGRSVLMLKNIQYHIIGGKVKFAWKPFRQFTDIKTNITGKPMQLRFVPQNSSYWMEICYQVEIPDVIDKTERIVGIDLGVNNFVTIANNSGVKPIIVNGRIIKSMNQYFNKKKSLIQSETGVVVNNRLRNLTDKHMRKIDYFMHCASKLVIDYCLKYNFDIIVIGKNDWWKDRINIGHKNNQTFESIPYEKFLTKLRYKAENAGIKVIETEESYTSGTSFLDNELPVKENYNKKRRKKRGLFKSNDGNIINADLNGAYQIIRKVFPNFEWDRGCDLHPIRFNV